MWLRQFICCLMIQFKHILILLLSVLSLKVAGQASLVSINQTDDRGKPHGAWYIYKEALRGEPSESVFGEYEHGMKTGLWYVSDGQGNMVSIESFKMDVRDGEAKYFENGFLTCIGHFRGLNPKIALDTVLITHPITGEEKLVYVPTERGSVRHGSWRFYDEFTGRLIKEEQYQIDELIYRKDFSISPADSTHFQQRNKNLPHSDNKLQPSSKFKTKSPTKSLIQG